MRGMVSAGTMGAMGSMVPGGSVVGMVTSCSSVLSRMMAGSTMLSRMVSCCSMLDGMEAGVWWESRGERGSMEGDVSLCTCLAPSHL